MKHLSKIWVRILISFIGAAIVDESFHISTGKSFNPGMIWIFAGIIYVLLWLIIWIYNWNQSKKLEE